MGTWKLNEAKSRLAPGMGKNSTVTYESMGAKIKVSVEGTDPKGQAIHHEWVGKFDGKDYPVTGDPTSDTRSYKKVNDHTLDMIVKKDSKVVATGQIVVASDGKTRTVDVHGTNPKGKKVHNVSMYDRQ